MPLAWLALGLVLGLYLSAEWAAPKPALLLLLGGAGGAWVLGRSVPLSVGLPLLVVVGVLLGLLRGGPDLLVPETILPRFHGQQVELRGAVRGLPEVFGARVRFGLEAREVRADGRWRPTPGLLQVWADAAIDPVPGRGHPFLAHGDLVTLGGLLDAPESIGAFDYREHLAARGIGSELRHATVVAIEPRDGTDLMGALHAVRAGLSRSLERHLPEPQAALTQALLLGLRGSLPPRLTQEFRDSGMAHLLAVSGMHVGVLLGLALLASAWLFGRRRSAYLLVPLVLLWLYIALAGAPPSAVRAGAMGSAYLLALATGRLSAPLNALGLAALALLVWDPAVLWDRSFQLSFTSMMGVLLIGLPLWRSAQDRLPPVARGGPPVRFIGLRLLRAIAAGVLVSVGAVVGSMPVVALNFQQIPLLGVPATLLALPALPVLLVSGVVTALLGLVAPPLADLAGLVPAVAAGFLAAEAALVSRVPWSVLEVSFVTAGWVWASYALLFAGLAWVHRRRWAGPALELVTALWRGPQRRVDAFVVVAAFAVLATVPWSLAAARTDGLLHVYFLDVGQGDATLLRTPGGAFVLIDGGLDPRVTVPLVDAVLPPGHRRIDVALLTHPHRDHLDGLLELARRGRIERLFVPPLVEPEHAAWRSELDTLGLAVHVGGSGTRIAFEDGVVLDILNPPDPPLVGTASDVDNNGLVVRVSLGEAAVLFTGDLFADGERLLIDRGESLAADVLKVGHHGSDTSTAAAFLRAVSPSMAVVSAGADNPLGHPSPGVLERVGAYVPGDLLFQTAEDGTIELATDGSAWWVVSGRD